jgi:phage baseplate assembly protein W
MSVIILTTQKEKLFSQYFGGNAYDLVFNSLSYVEIADKQLFLESAIKNNEPRVNVQSINIVYSEEGSWIISVLYNQKNSNNLAQNVTVII